MALSLSTGWQSSQTGKPVFAVVFKGNSENPVKGKQKNGFAIGDACSIARAKFETFITHIGPTYIINTTKYYEKI